ncbi:RHS repeat-associated core domain-containing protein [Dokdonella sp.]|uniref:RHS repeat-associated core domain-containing protein n=1 Tax=Dokdonella sp. TaxID=2291710 RepID=UPI001B0D8276|nr:RHS repeat-associated core domain-containing protein [Dokdonella sp.]MBO9661427.1 hypothetical protein [Dokdonella sp.]
MKEDPVSTPEEPLSDSRDALPLATAECGLPIPPGSGDPPAGAWWNPKRMGTGWTFAYQADTRNLRLVWHTYYPWTGGGATWLVSDFNKIVDGGQGRRNLPPTALFRMIDGKANGRVQVGTVSLSFYGDNATQARVTWSWKDPDHGVVGPNNSDIVATECLQTFFSDPRVSNAPSLVEPQIPPAPAAGTPGPYYSGLWSDESTPGFVLEVAQGEAVVGYTELNTLSVYDIDKKPVWLYVQRGPFSAWPSTDWAKSDIYYSSAKYNIAREDCSTVGSACTNTTLFPIATHWFGRQFFDQAKGVIDITVASAGSATMPSLSYPRTDWPATGSLGGCVARTDQKNCRPIIRQTDTQFLSVWPTVCDVREPNGTCRVKVNWTSDLLAHVERVDPYDTTRLIPHGNDGGIVGGGTVGEAQDTLTGDEHVLYRLNFGSRPVAQAPTASAYAAYSWIKATPNPCLIPLGDDGCQMRVTWWTPSYTDVQGSYLRIYRKLEGTPGDGERWVDGAGSPWAGEKPDRVEENQRVIYTVKRVIPGINEYWLATTSVTAERATITTAQNECSVPLGQSTCPITVTWRSGAGDAADLAKVYRIASNGTPTQIGQGAGGTLVDALPGDSRAKYAVVWPGCIPVTDPACIFAQSGDVSAVFSTISTSPSTCAVPPGQTCSIQVIWTSTARASVCRVDEATSTSVCPQGWTGARGNQFDPLPAGARVRYEVRIDNVVHAVTPTVIVTTDTEGGDSNTGTAETPGMPAAFAEPSLDTESDQVGAIAGEFRVDEGGNVVYRIPLAVPAGAGGLSPTMALVYNSSSPDGALGTGFSLEGTSAILPCRPSAEAGDGGSPSADPSQFCLDGQRLLWVGGSPHRQVGAIYRTEIETFQRVKLTAIENPGVQNHDATGFAFTVEGKDGSVRTYGGAAGTVSGVAVRGNTSTTGAPEEPGSSEPQPIPGRRVTAQGWLLTQLNDVAGNAITFQYSAALDAGERYLEKVSYSGGNVIFRYFASTRPEVAYSVLGPRQQTKLVSGIEVQAANGSTLRYYEPTYNTTATDSSIPVWSRSRPVLTSLKECSRQGGICYPATALTWSFASAPTDDSEGATLAAKPGGYYKLGDLNGDGRTDLWWTSSPNGNDNAQLHISAFTGDAGAGAPTLREVYTSPSLFPDGYNNGGLWEVIDFNGDGRDDLLFAYASCGDDECCPPGSSSCPPPTRMNWMLRLSTGTGLAPQSDDKILFSVQLVPAQVTKWANRLAAMQPAPNGTLRALGSSMLADVDGDGMADLVFRANDGTFWVALMRRTGASGGPYEFQVLPAQFQNEWGNPIEEDPNTCYVPENLTREEENYSQATDFDGDGRADLRFLVNARRVGSVGCGGAGEVDLQVFLAKGVQVYQGPFVFQAWQPFGALPAIFGNVYDDGDDNPSPRVRTLDVNGDGLTDLVYRATKQSEWRYRLGGPYAADRDFRVMDSLDADGTTADHNTLLLLDFDGDGKLDFWMGQEGNQPYVGNQPYIVHLWRGDNWSSTAVATTGYKTPELGWMQAMGDFDGDGSVDSLKADLNSRAWKLQRSKAHHKPRGLVTEITNGFGAKTKIDYAPLTFSSVYRRDYDAPLTMSGRGSPVFDVASPNYVVRSVKSSAPTPSSGDAESQVIYRYAGLKVQAGGRGSLGFRRVTSYDVQKDIEVNSRYQQRFPYTGLADFTETRNLKSLGFPGDSCARGGNPAFPGAQSFDSTQCMAYKPPCSSALESCDDDLRDIDKEFRIIRESSDRWQWRLGNHTGALAGACVDQTASSNSEEGLELPLEAGEDPQRPSCSGGVWAPPGELDRRTFDSLKMAGPIFLARIRSQSNSYDLSAGAGGAPLSIESAEFQIGDYDAYGHPKAGTTIKGGGGVSVTTASKFDYDNDEPNWWLGRLKTASVVTTRQTTEGGQTTTSTNVRRSSFTYDDKKRLASEKVEGVSGTSPDGAVDASVPAVAKYYYYDPSFGNRTKTFVCSTTIPEQQCRQQTASGSSGYSFHPAAETQVMRHGRVDYDASGRFVDKSWELFSNGLGASSAQEAASIVGARSAAGDPTRLTDVNGVRSEIRYGAMGRKRYTWTVDGSSTRWDARFCAGLQNPLPAGTPTVPCPQGMGLAYRATTTKAGAPVTMTFYDRLGRPTVTLTQGFATNSWIATIVQYDESGNVQRKSEPFFARDSGMYAASSVDGSTVWTQTTYDILNRPRQIDYPGDRTTKIDYDGLRTITTLPMNDSGFVQTKTEVANGLGEVVRAIDTNGSEVLTRYDAGGNPEQVSHGSHVTKMTYDSLGRRKTLLDPGAGSGSWVYQVNGAGEVVRETRPNGTSTKNEYDGRGRVWRRTDYTSAGVKESESTWTYDLVGKGVLAQESNGQVTRDFLYDGLGRPARLDTTLDGKSYTERWTYDSLGRPFQHLFKASDLSGETGERSVYSDGGSPGITPGYLSQMRSAYPLSDGRFLAYRQIESMNARGQVEKELGAAGSEYTQEREFEPATGRLKRLLAQSPTAGILQDLRYTYDKIGNVTSRIDNNGSRLAVETFSYDALQRLLTASVGDGLQTSFVRSQTYDVQGNIQTKSDVGSYTYGTRPAACSGGAPPYAVTATATTSALCYDANGNMVKRVTPQGTQTIAYTAADQATDIRDQRNRVGFHYGPNRERLRRLDYGGASATSALSVVHYVGGAEIRYAATAGNGAGALQEVRRYVGNVLVVQKASGGAYALKRQILLTDAQGSTHQVLGAMDLRPVNGTSPASFDPWGSRRDAMTWGSSVPWDAGLEQWLQNSTTHGYTGHEMAESVGVIHMNGRLYEPTLARFLQSDPFVQSPQDRQSWNRYSYAFNNPLAYTDPSGNISVGELIKVAVVAVFAYATGGAAAGLAAQGLSGPAFAVAVAGGFTAGAVQTGSLKGAAFGAVSAGVFFGIGSYFQSAEWAQSGEWESAFGSGLSYSGYAAKTLSHGVAGGVMADMQGGRFGHGFASAGFSEALSPAVGQISSTPVQAIAVAVVGGTASRLAGGKFANGAITAAFGYAFNELPHQQIIKNTKVVETLFSGKDESFESFTTRLSDVLVRYAEETSYKHVSALAYRDDDSYIEKMQYAGIVETQGSHIFSAATQIPVGFKPMKSTFGGVLRIHSHGLSFNADGGRIRANEIDMKYLPPSSGSKTPPYVPKQDRYLFSDQDAATRGGLATPNGLIWWPGERK